jgi:hypothetical protein
MISINITYYNEPHFLKWWYLCNQRLLDQGCNIMLNIGDDGSMVTPASDFFEKNQPQDNIRLFRVKEDIGFNSHGTRNLLMQHTTTKWNLMSDIDRRYTDQTLFSIYENEEGLKQGFYYSFWETIQSSPDRFSVNDYLVHRDDFWKTGGYDEEFVNIHYGDRYFLDTLRLFAKRKKVKQWEVKYIRGARDVTWSEDVETTIYPDDKTLIHPSKIWGNQEKRFALKDFVKQRNKTEEGRKSKKVVNFKWERVF